MEELSALVRMAGEILSGEPLAFDYSLDIDMGDEEITVIHMSKGGTEYLLTIEGSGVHAKVVLRSIEIPELLVSLPAPVYIAVGDELVTPGGEIC